MPKIPKKQSHKQDNSRMELAVLAEKIERIENLLNQAKEELSSLISVLYTTGFTKRGPIIDKDDIPF